MPSLAGGVDVLIIEPDRQLGEAYQQVLKNTGKSVKTTQNAEEALALLEKNIPKLITLEVQLPGHNGIELLHEMRSYADWRSIPVLLLTIIPEAELGLSRAMWGPLNIAGYYYKPQASLSKLTETVNAILEQA